jgi:pimeloyl-ACP methyl ester carboxylesterase
VTYIKVLGLAQADLPGWSMGWFVAQHVTLRRPDLVRKLVVAGSGPVPVLELPPLSEKVRVRGIMAKPDAGADDRLHLFYPETGAVRAAGVEHLTKVSTRLAAGGPAVSETAAIRQREAIGKFMAVPFQQVRANLENQAARPVGLHDRGGGLPRRLSRAADP